MSEITKTESKIPTFKELLHEVDCVDPEKSFKNDQFQAMLNYQPAEKWIQEHPIIKGWKYIPIGIIETLLKTIFKGGSYFEIVRETQMFNGIVVVARLHYWHPTLKEWQFNDGIGGEALQLRKGSAPSDIMNLNSGALTMGAGSAYATAKMSAAKQLGKIFGRDLNRELSLPYIADESLQDADTQKKLSVIEKCENLKHLKMIESYKDENELLFDAYMKKFDEIKLIDDAK